MYCTLGRSKPDSGSKRLDGFGAIKEKGLSHCPAKGWVAEHGR